MRRIPLAVAALLSLGVARVAYGAEGASVVIWPTMTPSGDAPSTTPLHKATPSDGKDLAQRSQELDATLRDAVQDLGFTLYVADQGPTPGHTRDIDLIERAAKAGAGGASNMGTWVVSPRLEPAGGDTYVLRIVAVPPNGKELRVRVEPVPADNLSVRGVVMLRDLLSPQAASEAAAEHERAEKLNAGANAGVMSPLRSQGRAVLAINSALFGGFLGYSVQRSSGSDDPRVLYPLLALGSGIGIGSALLVSEEWDVTMGDAWFLSAGAWWGAASGVLIANGRHVQPFEDRYTWGLGGGFIGLGLATVTLVKNRMDEGDAAIAQSGGAIGLFLGGVAELAYRGTTDVTPYTGMGYGSAIGLVAASALATRVTTSPSRVLLVDLGVGLGALAGAAVASPLIFQDNTSENHQRWWLGASLAGGLAGGTVAYVITRDAWTSKTSSLRYGYPTAGIIGASATPAGAVPAYGIAWQGKLP